MGSNFCGRVLSLGFQEETHGELRTFKGFGVGVHAVAFTPDGKKLITASGGDLKFWDAEKGVEQQSIKGVAPLLVTPDGTKLISATWNHKVQILSPP